MTDRDNRGRALRERLGRDDAAEMEETPESSETSEKSKTEEIGGDAAPTNRDGTGAADDGPDGGREADDSVKERRNVNMYLPEELVDELQIRFDELNARHRREHGEPMEKNREYYPTVIAAGLESEDLEERLGLE